MQQQRVQPNDLTYNSVNGARCDHQHNDQCMERTRMTGMALQLSDQMASEESSPDGITYSVRQKVKEPDVITYSEL